MKILTHYNNEEDQHHLKDVDHCCSSHVFKRFYQVDFKSVCCLDLQMGASTYYIITFSQIFDTPSPLCNQASSLSNSPPIIMSTSSEPEVSLRIQSKCGKIWTRKRSIFGHFSSSDDYTQLSKHLLIQGFGNIS